MFALTLAEQICDGIMRELDFQNASLVVLVRISRAVEDPSEGGFDPSHPCGIETRPTKLLVLKRPVGDIILEGLVEKDTLIIPLAVEHLHVVIHCAHVIVMDTINSCRLS